MKCLMLRYNRDELVLLRDHFFPYLTMLYDTRYKEHKELKDMSKNHYLQYLSCKGVKYSFNLTKEYINKRLAATKRNSIELRFTYMQLLEFYIILSQLEMDNVVNEWFKIKYNAQMVLIKDLLEDI